METVAKRGQSLIEACLAMGVLCLVFFGLFQLSQLAAAREVLFHAAARGARAKTVGFNHFMVSKAIDVAAIPNCGRLTQPDITDTDTTLGDMVDAMRPGELWDAAVAENPASAQYDIERARIPEFMGAWNWPRAHIILDYADWDTVRSTIPAFVIDGNIATVHVVQNYPLRVPLHRAYYGADAVELRGNSGLESHYPLYLDDQDW